MAEMSVRKLAAMARCTGDAMVSASAAPAPGAPLPASTFQVVHW